MVRFLRDMVYRRGAPLVSRSRLPTYRRARDVLAPFQIRFGTARYLAHTCLQGAPPIYVWGANRSGGVQGVRNGSGAAPGHTSRAYWGATRLSSRLPMSGEKPPLSDIPLYQARPVTNVREDKTPDILNLGTKIAQPAPTRPPKYRAVPQTYQTIPVEWGAPLVKSINHPLDRIHHHCPILSQILDFLPPTLTFLTTFVSPNLT